MAEAVSRIHLSNFLLFTGKQDLEFIKQDNRHQDLLTKQNISEPATHIKLLKRSDLPTEVQADRILEGKQNNEFEKLIASLKLSGQDQTPTTPSTEDPVTTEEHLSPQSFAMKGTQMLKEILKIDSSDSGSQLKDMKKDPITPVQHKQTKQMAAHMNRAHGAGPPFIAPNPELKRPPLLPQPLVTPVTELCRICSFVGMHPPEFSLMRTPQNLTFCHVKLSNGLAIQGPPCHTDNDAKEKAALYALQRLSTAGANFPLPSPLFPNFQPLGTGVPTGALPVVFPQSAGNVIPPAPHVFNSVNWRPPVPHPNKPYYQGTYPGHMPAGSHNQFIPLQVTKQRAAGNKSAEVRETPGFSQGNSSNDQRLIPDVASQLPPDSSPQSPQPPAKDKSSPNVSLAPRAKPSPGSGSKRKPRKLAVNFSVSKASE
ncbi:5'-3' exoribonuclease 1-like [Pyxicephalus adspersus]|uniref:5'-3' exoribonuclease 1-like n=1 Tax=Pyxicephalus adspersus TaxID=30357 RepID=UPI003B598CE6